MIKHNLTSESTLIINYTFGLNQPILDKSIQEEDWISDL